MNSTTKVVLGQSLKPDGSAPQVLLDRAAMARKLLQEGAVTKVVVSGGDPANVGHTEASMFAKVLVREGIPEEAIITESQATTTAENAWFLLRWIPKGTGRLFIITSDFHMPRATYIFKAVLNHFYMMLEERYKKDPRWIPGESWVALRQIFRRFRAEPALNLKPKALNPKPEKLRKSALNLKP